MDGIHPVVGILGLGTQELVIIFLIIILFFGASKLPGVARSLGKSVNEFKAGMREGAEAPKPDAPAKDPGSANN
jgi:sec-independent protein translocase protein TatA